MPVYFTVNEGKKKFGTQAGVHLIESVCLIWGPLHTGWYLYLYFLVIQWFFPGRPEGQTLCKILSYTISLSYLTKIVLSAYATNMLPERTAKH